MEIPSPAAPSGGSIPAKATASLRRRHLLRIAQALRTQCEECATWNPHRFVVEAAPASRTFLANVVDTAEAINACLDSTIGAAPVPPVPMAHPVVRSLSAPSRGFRGLAPPRR